MMGALPPHDRRKLVGVLGMLGSDAVGERAAAALLATRMMKAAGLRWDDVIDAAPAQRQPPPRPQSRPADGWEMEFCWRHLGAVNAWEAHFIQSVRRSRKRTARQTETLAGIANSLRARGLA